MTERELNALWYELEERDNKERELQDLRYYRETTFSKDQFHKELETSDNIIDSLERQNKELRNEVEILKCEMNREFDTFTKLTGAGEHQTQIGGVHFNMKYMGDYEVLIRVEKKNPTLIVKDVDLENKIISLETVQSPGIVKYSGEVPEFLSPGELEYSKPIKDHLLDSMIYGNSMTKITWKTEKEIEKEYPKTKARKVEAMQGLMEIPDKYEIDFNGFESTCKHEFIKTGNSPVMNTEWWNCKHCNISKEDHVNVGNISAEDQGTTCSNDAM